MKKSLLICILVLVLSLSVVFAACAPSLDADTLASMKELIYQMYKDSNPANTYEVVALVASNGEKANIQWTVNVTEGSADYVKVGKLEDNKQTIDVEPYPATDVKYTLTATLTNEKGKAYEIDGEPVSISFERSLKAFVLNTYEEYIAACAANDGTQIRIKGYVIGVVCMSSSSAGSLYIQDADGHGYYAYKPTGATDGCETDADLRAKWAIGTEVIVTGTVTTYNGQYEFNKDCTLIVTGEKATEEQLPYVDATADFAAATSNEDVSLAKYQNRRVTLKDVIITRIDETGTKGTSDYKAYYYFTVGDSDVEFNVYYTIYFIDDATATAVCDKLVVGKKVDLTGIISVYSKDFQVYPDSANSVSNVRDVEYTDAEKVAVAKENLTLDSAITEPKSIDLPATGDLGTTITWAFAEGTTADFIAIADGKLTVSALPAATTEVTVIATITSGTASDTKEFKVSVVASFVMSETHAYAGFVNQVKAAKQLYLDGGVNGRYLTTTEDATKAVAVYAESATNGYKLYILVDGTKQYITIYSNAEGKTSVNYDAAGTTVYTYNPVVNAFTTTFNGTEVYLGTYNTYDTISVSNLSYINAENTGVDQFPLELVPAIDGATYAASLTQVKLENKVLYLNGEVSGRYLATTEDATAAVTIYAEKVEGGFKFYKLNGETKEYINLYNNAESKLSVNYDAAGTSVFAYDATVNAWVTVFEETEYYLGTYNTFNTVSASKLSYITADNTGVDQFPLEYNPVVVGTETPAHTCESVCAECGGCLDAECTETACATKCAGHEATVEEVVINASELTAGQLTADAEIVAGTGVYATTPSGDSKLVVDANSKSIDDFSFTQRLKLGGTMKVADGVVTDGLKLELKGAATITVYAMSSSSGSDRNLLLATLADNTFTTVGTQVALGASISKQTYTVTAAGTYYLGSENSGINIYYIAISYEAQTPAHTCESVCAECGGCLDAECTETACATKCAGHAITTIAGALAAEDGVAVELTGTVTGHYNGYKSNFYIQDEEGNSILVYYSTADANIGDVVKVVGTLGSYNGTKQVAQGSTFTVVTPHVCSAWTEATCLEAAKCTVCGTANGEALGHTEANAEGKCDRCGAVLNATGTVATFTFGDNGEAAHKDGNDLGTSTTYTDGAYSLVLTDMSKVYGPAYDATGNSCLKLGTGSKTATLTFAVPENVTSVVIYVAGYKANTVSVDVNGTETAITTCSNDGAYTAITIDTTTVKTITLATTTGYRCMINTIEFVVAE